MHTDKALSLFSGLGGLDLGVRLAGANVGLSTDVDETALDLLNAATGVRTLAGDIETLLEGQLRETWGDDAPFLIVGGPPCTAFSHAGFWISSKRDGGDPAAKLLGSYMRAVAQFQPQAFVMENVPGLAFSTHVAWLREVRERATDLGYRTTMAVLHASAFGVPQHRRRLFLVGVRDADPPDLTQWPVAFPIRTARWAIGDVPQLPEPDEQPGPLYAELLADVPPGGNYLHFTAERGATEPLFKYRGRYWSFLLKLDPDRPAPTLPARRITYNGPFHWTNRHLRIREIARLQGFPDWYPLTSDLGLARRHLGNAVPPLLAAAVVWRVLAVLGMSSLDTPPRALEVAAAPAASVDDVLGAFARDDDAAREVA